MDCGMRARNSSPTASGPTAATCASTAHARTASASGMTRARTAPTAAHVRTASARIGAPAAAAPVLGHGLTTRVAATRLLAGLATGIARASQGVVPGAVRRPRQPLVGTTAPTGATAISHCSVVSRSASTLASGAVAGAVTHLVAGTIARDIASALACTCTCTCTCTSSVSGSRLCTVACARIVTQLLPALAWIHAALLKGGLRLLALSTAHGRFAPAKIVALVRSGDILFELLPAR
jgi:hypothetical protein